MQVTKRGIAKLEQSIHELRTLIERFKEYLGEKVKQGAEPEEMAKKEISQEAPIITQATAQTSTPRRWRM